jgi:hypothetical protein
MPVPARESLLADSIAQLRASIDALRALAAEAESYLLDSMRARKATVASLDGLKVTVATKRDYDYVVEGGLDALQNHVPPDEYDAAVKPYTAYKIDKRKLNQFKARGEPVASIIESSARVTKETVRANVERV